jgi:hypothetical protein
MALLLADDVADSADGLAEEDGRDDAVTRGTGLAVLPDADADAEGDADADGEGDADADAEPDAEVDADADADDSGTAASSSAPALPHPASINDPTMATITKGARICSC